MPIPSAPLTFTCRSCNWKKTFPFQISDCRIPCLNHFEQCPQCGGAVETRHTNLLDVLVSRIGQEWHKPR